MPIAAQRPSSIGIDRLHSVNDHVGGRTKVKWNYYTQEDIPALQSRGCLCPGQAKETIHTST